MTTERSVECPRCSGTATLKVITKEHTALVPSVWGEDETYENYETEDYVIECTECDYFDCDMGGY